MIRPIRPIRFLERERGARNERVLHTGDFWDGAMLIVFEIAEGFAEVQLSDDAVFIFMEQVVESLD